MKPLANEQGSMMLETVITIGGFITFFAGCLLAFYAAFVNVWLNRQAYEAVICLASTAEPSFCDQRLRKDASGLVSFGSLEDFHVQRSTTEARASFTYRIKGLMGVKDYVHLYHDSRHLPITGEG